VSNPEICWMSVIEMVEAIKTKMLSPVEIMDALLSRIERLNPKVNAYCLLLAESAMQQAKEAETMVMTGMELGPLHGVPTSIKDMIFTKGLPTTTGSKVYEDFVPQQDAVVVERLKATGAIIIGKTNVPEFGGGFDGITDNLLFGLTRNPWNLECTTGGSSGGAAAQVAAGMGPLAIGSDRAGSIRIPCSFCGIFGFKPSFGRVPQYPTFPGWQPLSATGPITRTVKDAALVMEVIAGRDDRDRWSLPDTGLRYLPFLGTDLKGLKIAWSENLGYPTTEPEVLKITEAAAKTFGTLGATVEPARPEVKSPWHAFATVAGVSLASRLQDNWDEWRDMVMPHVVRSFERNKDRLAIEYGKAELELMEYYNGLQPFFEKYDLVLTPTVAMPAFEIAAVIAGDKKLPNHWGQYTYPFAITGQPASSVPCGWTDDGLPVGLQIIGRRFDDVTVLRASAAFEQASPWTDRRPPLD